MSKNKQYDKRVRTNILDKDQAMRHFTHRILNKTTQIFEYEGLPDSIPPMIVERFLQTNGNLLFHEVKGTLYVFTGGVGGQYDVYYRPTIYTIANPYLNYSAMVEIGKDGVLMRNDSYEEGLYPIIEKYGAMLIEADISLRNAIVNTRDFNAISAQDDKTRASAEEYQRQIEAGKTAVIGESAMLESLKRHPTPPNSGTLTDLKEIYQFIKAQLYSDLGMKTAHNMKSQYVSDAENIINDDTLLPLIQDMLQCRQDALDEVNDMFDLNITVKLKGSWNLQQEKVDQEIEMLEERGELIEEAETEEELEDIATTEPEEVDEVLADEEVEEDSEEPETETEEVEEENETEEVTEADIDIDIEVIVDSETEEETEDEEVK